MPGGVEGPVRITSNDCMTAVTVYIMRKIKDVIYPSHGLFAYAHSPTQLNGTPSSTEHEPHHVILKVVDFYIGYLYIEILGRAP